MVLGLCGLKNLRIKRKANGFKKERSERSNPLETPSFSLMSNDLGGYKTKFRWPQAHASG